MVSCREPHSQNISEFSYLFQRPQRHGLCIAIDTQWHDPLYFVTQKGFL